MTPKQFHVRQDWGASKKAQPLLSVRNRFKFTLVLEQTAQLCAVRSSLRFGPCISLPAGPGAKARRKASTPTRSQRSQEDFSFSDHGASVLSGLSSTSRMFGDFKSVYASFAVPHAGGGGRVHKFFRQLRLGSPHASASQPASASAWSSAS